MIRILGERGSDERTGVANEHVYRPKPSASNSSLRAPNRRPIARWDTEPVGRPAPVTHRVYASAQLSQRCGT